MTARTRKPARWVIPDNPCNCCWFRPAAAGWATCTPCFFRPDRWRVPCTCTDQIPEVVVSTCPHGKTGHCEQCPRATATHRAQQRHDDEDNDQ